MHLELVVALFGRLEGRLPFTERVLAQLFAQLGGLPGLAAIGRDRDLGNALAAVERDAAQHDFLAGLQLRTVLHAGDERARVEAVDRNGLGRSLAGRRARAVVGGNAVGRRHPETVEDLVEHLDVIDMLDPVRAVVTRHDQAQRVAVEHRQVLVVHRPGQHDFAVQRVIDVERLHKVRAAVDRWLVHAVEADLHRALLDAGLFQHALERHTGPLGVAHGTVAELAAVGARLEEAAAVARALVCGDQTDRFTQLLERVERQVEWRIHQARDLQAEFLCLDVGGNAAPVVAHEERIVRRDQSLVEHLEGRLQLRWAAGLQNQRALLRERDHFAFAIRKRQRDGLGGGRIGGQGTQGRAEQPGSGACRAKGFQSAASALIFGARLRQGERNVRWVGIHRVSPELIDFVFEVCE